MSPHAEPMRVGCTGWSIPATSARGFPRSGKPPGTVRAALRGGRDQLLVLPAPSAPHLRAVGRDGARRLPLRGQVAAHRHARRPPGRGGVPRARPLPGRGRASGRPARPAPRPTPPGPPLRRGVAWPRSSRRSPRAPRRRSPASRATPRGSPARPTRSWRRCWVARVAADPALVPAAAAPGGWPGWSTAACTGVPSSIARRTRRGRSTPTPRPFGARPPPRRSGPSSTTPPTARPRATPWICSARLGEPGALDPGAPDRRERRTDQVVNVGTIPAGPDRL